MDVLEGPPLNYDDVVNALDDVVRRLEECAAERDPSFVALEYPAQEDQRLPSAPLKVVWNQWDGILVKLRNYAEKNPPARQKRSYLAAKEAEGDPAQGFRSVMAPIYQLVKKHAKKIGGKVAEQVILYGSALEKLAQLIGSAATKPKPLDYKEFTKEVVPLIVAADKVAAFKFSASPKDPLINHYTVIGEAAAMLGWVTAPAAVTHVNEYTKVCVIFIDNILASFIELGCDPTHSDFAEAARAMVEEMASYVKKEHSAGLRWNYVKGSTPLGYKGAKIIIDESTHPLADFIELVDGPLERFLWVSQKFGSLLYRIAQCIEGAFIQQYEMIKRAAITKQEKTYVGLKLMFSGTMHEIQPIRGLAEGAPKDYKYVPHLTTMVEFSSMLTWPIVESIPPVQLISDAEGAVRIFCDKILSQYGTASAFHEHVEWTEAIKMLGRSFREYVTKHHAHGLSFDTKVEEIHVLSFMKKKEVAYRLAKLKEENAGKVKHHPLTSERRKKSS